MKIKKWVLEVYIKEVAALQGLISNLARNEDEECIRSKLNDVITDLAKAKQKIGLLLIEAKDSEDRINPEKQVVKIEMEHDPHTKS